MFLVRISIKKRAADAFFFSRYFRLFIITNLMLSWQIITPPLEKEEVKHKFGLFWYMF